MSDRLLVNPAVPISACALLCICIGACGGSPEAPRVLSAEMPLHLEDHLDVATLEGSEVPADLPEPVEWRFDELQPDWKPAYAFDFGGPLVTPVQAGNALRVRLSEEQVDFQGDRCGSVYTDLPAWQLHEWAYVAVEARAEPGMEEGIGLAFNLTEPARAGVSQAYALRSPVIADGTVQTYLLGPTPTRRASAFDGTWRQLLLWFCASEPSVIDLLSVKVIPKEAAFGSAPAGVSMETLQQEHRRTLYTHAPGRLTYQVRVPDGGQLDVGLRIVRQDAPVTFRVTATPGGGEAQTRFEETVADTGRWAQRRVDLSDLAGQTVSLALEADAERAGSVALWAAPTMSGAHRTERPNIVFYVIDGAGADFMSLYGYNRRTTPNLERLAEEGIVFDRAYSNSTWTRPSTLSFLTSLHHSVLGGLKGERNIVPDGALTLAEHLHRAGYQTAELTSNPNAGSASGLAARGNDVFRDTRVQSNAASSVGLHEQFWQWREAYPAEPYAVHFQTTDVHGPLRPVAPFAGLFVAPEQRALRGRWMQRVQFAGPFSEAFARTGVDRIAYFSTGQGLYDELMAHQDYQLGRLVEHIKARGEWERTLLIVASDHGVAAGDRDLSLGVLESLPPIWGPYFRSSTSRIPLLVVWPERIQGGQRFSEPVSMIDVLPTILELVGVPMPEVAQGQSLAPLLLGEDGWEPRPVIFDEFRLVQETGELTGQIEVIDGRWGASLEINPQPGGDGPWLDSLGAGRPAPLLLYDLWNDPMCLYSLHEERPDLVEKYTTFLEAQWETHRALAQQFTPGEESPLTPEQLRTLRSLGYIR